MTDSGIAIRVYVPTNVLLGSTLPLGVFAHGGGHAAGGMCRYIAHHSNVIIAQVDFRLAPEYPIPTQVNDCFDAFIWNLGYMVCGVVILCPALLHPDFVPSEYRSMFQAYKQNWKGAPLQDGERHNNDTIQCMNPYAFPCLHPGIRRLPPTYQATCEADPVRDDSMVLKFQLDQAGIPNKSDTYPGMPHYFWLFPQLSSSEVFHQTVVEGIKWVLSLVGMKRTEGSVPLS
ncbi:alpha/beta-hydrolase [Aspergillus sclerotioniger CBS 115572]|uniref:Alpha/beta-hydrolase n=1 Tax=Aspergillus sclerotioniger CBS 115572 TaxID=1450535 RepID=A0A317X4T6_9EURO|nr:alpha/beta-hydrolase [Aspergillus sclerotioniger CBS 115572]PWY93211.1 alpha/beta-hydrolase [Aspergillus sclerotioniger CBS 115572]